VLANPLLVFCCVGVSAGFYLLTTALAAPQYSPGVRLFCVQLQLIDFEIFMNFFKKALKFPN